MISYLLKSILCLAILLLVYLLFLEKEKMHRFNRWYLLGSVVFSNLVPLISFTVTGKSLPALQAGYSFFLNNNNDGLLQHPVSTVVTSPQAVVEKAGYVVPVLLALYSLVTLVLLTRFIRNIYGLLSNAAAHKTIVYKGANLVLLKEKTASYSFLHYIFISEEDYSNQAIEEEILIHELTHVKEKHSWDIVLIELLHSICWFNPMFIFYKKAIRLNHEYLADEAVVKSHADVPAYQILLLDKAGCSSHASFTSNFNYSVTKKRLVMMTRKYNPIQTLFKKISIIPVLAVVVFFSGAKVMMAQEKPKSQPTKNGQKKVPEMLMNSKSLEPGKGASKEMLDELNAIIDRNQRTTKNGHLIVPSVTKEERVKMEAIYQQMNQEQRDHARIAFSKAPPPLKKSVPTAEQFEKFKDDNVYGVWIGSKKIKNEELNNYKPEDFSQYDISNLNYTEEMKKNVMASFNLKKMYKYQLNLMTNSQYADYYERAVQEPKINLFFIVPDNKTEGRKVRLYVASRP